MFEKFAGKFLTNIFVYGFVSVFLAVPYLIYYLLTSYLFLGIGAIGLFLFVVAYGTYKELVESSEKEYKAELQRISVDSSHKIEDLEQNLKVATHEENMWRQLLKERASGFPSLFTNISYYEELIDEELSGYLRHKSHPAVSASEMVKIEASRRREAEFNQRTTKALIEYYESIAPFLLDFKEEIIDENDDSIREYNEEEQQDPVTNFLAKEEYRELSTTERNQTALDRYWKRPMSKWLIGRMYERYVGYLYEQKGYDVEYTGIFHGYEDLGRDLVCTKGNEIVIIQCKNWSQFKTIYEKHIFQFFGTVFQYRDQNPNKQVRAIFYTTTELSELARRFAKELNIELQEKCKMVKGYPCIKCNISMVDGARIYHLPFDQQYDNTRIEIKKGEMYCQAVEEAEKAGFRRAFKWRGDNSNA